ncbi:hypothetical protein PanWU01x14_200260, partial [Parasponia andersonii]
CDQPTVAAKVVEQKMERGRLRTRKRTYRSITKSPNATNIPDKNSFSALKKALGGEIYKGKKESLG